MPLPFILAGIGAAQALPVAIAFVGSYLGARIITGAVETLAARQEVTEAEKRLAAVEVARARQINELNRQITIRDEADRRALENRAFQTQLRERGESFTTERDTARVAEIAARDDAIRAEREIAELRRQDTALQLETRRLTESRAQQQRAFAEQAARDQAIRDDRDARDAANDAQRAAEQAAALAFRQQIEDQRAVQEAQRLAAQEARLRLDVERAQREEARLREIERQRRETALPLTAELLTDESALVRRIRNLGVACVRWQDIVANGWAVAVNWSGGRQAIITAANGRTFVAPEFCAWGYSGVALGDLVDVGVMSAAQAGAQREQRAWSPA